MKVFGADKSSRLLKIYSKLVKGCIVNKSEEAANFNVDERTIQRDIAAIKDYMGTDMTNNGVINSIIYDKDVGGYRIESSYQGTLSNSETLAVCKILLDSRAFPKDVMQEILDKLISCCVPKENRQPVKELIGNEEHNYIELRHKTNFLDTLWDLGQAIRSCRYVELEYRRTKDKAIVKRKVKPVGIMFSEYYFYITAFIDDKEVCENFDVINDAFPTIYRVDRIVSYRVLEDRFKMPYKNRFEEGEFRKRIQFMYGGKLNRICFEYTGSDVDAILDRLPTAKIESEKDGKYIIRAEVFGKGIDMWLRSQGENVRVI
ncbi:WYL domain-containing transcriptional regulator [Lachnoanaerobaculum orale]|uniref:WYL domain-containing transcriptional regulator n=1 Tax=Lachnoanaerobaculum orale TaxID=979627 RepID=A0A3P3PZG7_9FIRM|nr:WYL domain-containing protein [Lachnoanaerobaculum orale]RRJ14098.1 WYL domain-containing transcriptional regulator [Lachnoanaerobaculum orale]